MSWDAGLTAPRPCCLFSRSSSRTTSGSGCTGMPAQHLFQLHWCSKWKSKRTSSSILHDVTVIFFAVETPMGECRSLPAGTPSTSSSSLLLQNGGHGSAALRCSTQHFPPLFSSLKYQCKHFLVWIISVFFFCILWWSFQCYGSMN